MCTDNVLIDALLVFNMTGTEVCDFVIIVFVIPNLTGCVTKLT